MFCLVCFWLGVAFLSFIFKIFQNIFVHVFFLVSFFMHHLFVLTYVWWGVGVPITIFYFIFYLCFSQVVNFVCCFLYTVNSGGRGLANISFCHKLFC